MSDNVTDLTPRILMDIRDELRALNQRVGTTNERLDALTTSVGQRFDDVNQRFDNLILAAGAGRGDHERRLAHLETRVDRLEKRAKPKR